MKNKPGCILTVRHKRDFSTSTTMKALFFLLMMLPLSPWAQSVRINGQILDAHTKEPVAYASVFFKQAGTGTTSDTAGKFSVVLFNRPSDTLMISYVGYEVAKIGVKQSSNEINITVNLERGGLKDFVIRTKKVNRGLYLWKKIMSKKKQYNRYNLDNFSYEAYNKLEVDIKNFNVNKAKKNFLIKPFSFVFDNIDSVSEKEPFLPAYLIETMSDYAYQKNPRKYQETIKASNTKGFANESISKMLGVMNQNVNIYGNFVNVMDRDFIGPFNENADAFYQFSVPDTQVVQGVKIFHFVFKPKRAGQSTFEGDAWVTEKTYQIRKISLYLGKDANVNYINRISIFQEFIPLNDSTYFLNRDKFFADFTILGKQSLTLIGRKSTSYKNINVNSDSITNLLVQQNIEEKVITLSGNNTKTDSAWSAMRHDSLSVNEKAIYETVDKLLQMPKFQKMKKRIKFLATGYNYVGNLEIGPWFNWISSNVWEGTRFRFDLGTNPGFHKNIYLHGYLAYGTKDKKIKGRAEAYWLIKRKPRLLRIHVAYSKDIDNGVSQIGEVSQDNIFSLAIRKPNVSRKFLQLEDSRFEILNEWGKGFSTEAFFLHRIYTPLQNLPFVAEAKTAPINNFEVALKIRYAYLEQFLEGDYFRYSLGSKYPIVELTLGKGFPGVVNSDYNYKRINLSIKDNFRLSTAGSLSYKIYGGKIQGTVPFTFLENHPGNDIYYYNKNTFNLMTRFEYLSDTYAGVNVEHGFGSGLFRFIPLTRKLKWRQFWNVKCLWGNLSQANQELNNSENSFKILNRKMYMELGTGIDNILKILRVDLVWKLSPGAIPGQSKSEFGVFGSFQFKF